MILHFEIKQSDNKQYRALIRCDAGVGRDKSYLITTKTSLHRFAELSNISIRSLSESIQTTEFHHCPSLTLFEEF